MKKTILISLIVSLSLNALTLKESVKEVMATNPELKEKKQNYEATLKDVDIAKTEWLPKIDLISSYNLKSSGKINNSVQDNEYTTFQNSLRLTQNLFNGYSTVNKIDYQEKRALSSFAYYLEAVNDVSLRMTKAYLDVLRNSLLLKNAKENVESTEKIYQDVKSLYDAGLTTKSEMIKIQASLSLAKSNYVVQQNNFIN